jgi:hypothetical protein
MKNIARVIPIGNSSTRSIEEVITDNIHDLILSGYKVISTCPINNNGTTANVLIVFEKV